jgi:hypothetical protein
VRTHPPFILPTVANFGIFVNRELAQKSGAQPVEGQHGDGGHRAFTSTSLASRPAKVRRCAACADTRCDPNRRPTYTTGARPAAHIKDSSSRFVETSGKAEIAYIEPRITRSNVVSLT